MDRLADSREYPARVVEPIFDDLSRGWTVSELPPNTQGIRRAHDAQPDGAVPDRASTGSTAPGRCT